MKKSNKPTSFSRIPNAWIPQVVGTKAGQHLASLLDRLDVQRELVDRGLSAAAPWSGQLRKGSKHSEASLQKIRGAFNNIVSGDCAEHKGSLDPELLLKIHDLAVGTGGFRKVAVRVGKHRCFPKAKEVPELVTKALAKANSRKDHPVVVASAILRELLLIHPFSQGNGRTSRLLATLYLIEAGFKSTLLTAFEQHYDESIIRYFKRWSCSVSDTDDVMWLLHSVSAMLFRTHHLAWLREREEAMLEALQSKGVSDEKELEENLIQYDFERKRFSENRIGIPRLTTAIGRSRKSDVRALHFQLKRIREEEKAQGGKPIFGEYEDRLEALLGSYIEGKFGNPLWPVDEDDWDTELATETWDEEFTEPDEVETKPEDEHTKPDETEVETENSTIDIDKTIIEDTEEDTDSESDTESDTDTDTDSDTDTNTETDTDTDTETKPCNVSLTGPPEICACPSDPAGDSNEDQDDNDPNSSSGDPGTSPGHDCVRTYTAQSNQPGRFIFRVIGTQLKIVSITANQIKVRGVQLGWGMVAVLFISDDGCKCTDSVRVLVKGVLLKPDEEEIGADLVPKFEEPIAVWQHRPLFKIETPALQNQAVDGNGVTITAAANNSNQLYRQYDYSLTVSGKILDPTEMLATEEDPEAEVSTDDSTATLTVAEDLGFTLRLTLRGLGNHLVECSVVNGIGYRGSLRLRIQIEMGAQSVQAATALRQAGTALKQVRETGENSFKALRDVPIDGQENQENQIVEALEVGYESAANAYDDLQNWKAAEAAAEASIEVDQVNELEAAQGILYKIIGVAYNEDKAVVGNICPPLVDSGSLGDGENEEIPMIPLGTNPIMHRSDPGKKIAFVKLGTDAGIRHAPYFKNNQIVPIKVRGPDREVGVTFAECTGCGRTYGLEIDLVDTAPLGAVAYKDGESLETTRLELRANPIPERISGIEPQIRWQVHKSPPSSQMGLRDATDGSSELQSGYIGNYLLRPYITYGESEHNATLVEHDLSIYGAQLEMRYPDAYRAEDVVQGKEALGDWVITKVGSATDTNIRTVFVVGVRLHMHPLDPRVLHSIQTRFNWRNLGAGQIDVPSTDLNHSSYSVAHLEFPKNASSIRVQATLRELVLDSEEISLGRRLSDRQQSPQINVRAGQPANFLLQGRLLHRSGAQWVTIDTTPIDPAAPPDLSATVRPLHNSLQPSTSYMDIIDMRLQVLDAMNRPVEDGTPVGFHLLGGGELGDVRNKPVDETVNGYAYKQMRAAFDPRTQLVLLSAGAKQEWFGSESQLVDIGMSLRNGVPPSATSTIDADHEGRTEVVISPRLHGQALPDGTKVKWSITHGSLRDSDLGHFAPTATTTFNGGTTSVAISPRYYSPDGTRNYFRMSATGKVKITATIGSKSEVKEFEFSRYPVQFVPRVVLPQSGLVRQSNLSWVPNNGTNGPLGTVVSDRIQIVGKRNEPVFVDINQDRYFEEIARFEFSGHENEFRSQSQSIHYARPLNLRINGSGTRVQTTGIAAGGPGSVIRLEEAFLFADALECGPIMGLTNFEFELLFSPAGRLDLPTGVTDVFTIMEGGPPTGRQFGNWRINLLYDTTIGGTTGTWIEFRYFARGCTNRSVVSESVVVPWVSSTGWTRIRFSVQGHLYGSPNGIQPGVGKSPGEPGMNETAADRRGYVELKLTSTDVTTGVANSASATSSNFNWLPGTSQAFEVWGSLRSDLDIGQIILRAEINQNYNFDRFGDGKVSSATGLVSLNSGTNSEGDNFLNLPPAPQNAQTLSNLPNFDKSIQYYGRVATSYCASGHYVERVDLAILNDTGLAAFDGVLEFLSGFVAGEEDSISGIAGDVVAGFLVWGDVRDIGKNLAYFAAKGGKEPDWLNFSIAILGLLADVGEFVTAGAATPANVIVGVLKPVIRLIKKMADVNNPRLRRLLQNLGSILAREMMAILIHWRKIRAGQISLAVAPLFEALYSYFSAGIRPEDFKHMNAFAKRMERVVETSLQTALLGLAPVPPFTPLAAAAGGRRMVAWFENWDVDTQGPPEDGSTLAEELAAVRRIADHVMRKMENLAMFFNTQIDNSQAFVRLLQWLAHVDLGHLHAGAVLDEIRGKWLEDARKLDAAVQAGRKEQFGVKSKDWLNAAPEATSPNALARAIVTIAEQLKRTPGNDLDKLPSMLAMRGLAGHLAYLGLFRTMELVYRLGGGEFADGNLLEKTLRQMNSAFLAAIHHNHDTHQEVVRRFLLPLTGGNLAKGTTDTGPHGTLFELDILEMMYTAMRRTSEQNKIALSPGATLPGGRRVLGADMDFDFVEPVLRMPKGQWIAEMKAYFPTSANIADRAETIRIQFISRIQQATALGKPLNFAYFFRGEYHEEFIQALVRATEAVPGVKGLDGKVFRFPESGLPEDVFTNLEKHGGPGIIRLHVEHMNEPQQLLSVTNEIPKWLSGLAGDGS